MKAPSPRTGFALAVANARYWESVAPVVRAQLERWERRARAIPDPALRAMALAKLHGERFNAEVAAALATLAPRARRACATEAIVALQVAYDYLDGLTEQPAADPLQSGRQLSLAFTDALGPAHGRAGGGASDGEPAHGDTRAAGGEPMRREDYFREHPSDDGGYLAELSAATSAAIARLPAWSAVSEVAHASAARCAEAQVRVHVASRTGAARLEQWARAQAGTELDWREYLAGAVSSVLAVHALIVAAANRRTTPAQAAQIDSAYVSIAALSTMLDSAIDYEEDRLRGEPWHMRLYEDPATLADAVARVIADARARVKTLPDTAHHMLMLVGVAAYYTSAPQAGRGIAAAATGRVRDELGPSLRPALAVMGAWRTAKALRGALGGERRTAQTPLRTPGGEQHEPKTPRGTPGGKRRTAPAVGVSVDEVTATLEHP